MHINKRGILINGLISHYYEGSLECDVIVEGINKRTQKRIIEIERAE